MKNSLSGIRAIGTWLLIWLFALPCAAVANDVLPRMLINVPINTNYLGVAYTRSEGNVSVDPSLALDVEAKMDTWMASYTRAFAAFGQSATFTAALPYADLQLSGIVDGQQVTARGDEMPDPRFSLYFNLAGAPALELKDFASYRQKTIVGLKMEVSLPWGDYQPERAVNFGANRWTVTSELGVGRRFKRISLEAVAGVTFFSDNDEYLVDNTLKQEAIGTIRANLIYHFRRPGTWLGISSLYLRGGETTVNGGDRNDLQANSRAGVALSVPFGRRHSVLFKYSSGVTTRIGADFDNYGIRYTLMF